MFNRKLEVEDHLFSALTDDNAEEHLEVSNSNDCISIDSLTFEAGIQRQGIATVVKVCVT